MKIYSQYLSSGTFTIFLFHGVIKEQRFNVRNYNLKHITVERFEEVLIDLTDHGTPLTMDEVVRAHTQRESLPENSFVITFDDGFRNNYLNAAPILLKRNVPAIFYVTTGFIEHNSMSWIDQIESVLETRDEIRIGLPLIDGHYRTRAEKIALLERIRSMVKNNPKSDPYALAAMICESQGKYRPDRDSELDQKMSWDEVRELSHHDLFNVGGHGHSHRILAYLSEEELSEEIATSLMLLEGRLKKRVRHYSYPEGLPTSYSQKVIDLLRSRGIDCAPTAIEGVNKVDDDLFHLKRIMVT
jgi:peptidoglycan/xylan/chitin deacetylase (PgdA/CDA1 family)